MTWYQPWQTMKNHCGKKRDRSAAAHGFVDIHSRFALSAVETIGKGMERREKKREKEKEKKALREDRTPDLSLTKRVLYRLSY